MPINAPPAALSPTAVLNKLKQDYSAASLMLNSSSICNNEQNNNSGGNNTKDNRDSLNLNSSYNNNNNNNNISPAPKRTMDDVLKRLTTKMRDSSIRHGKDGKRQASPLNR